MLVEIWINQNGQYNFYFVQSDGFMPDYYFALKGNRYSGSYDSLDECKKYTIEYDNRYGDDSVLFPNDSK